jgi:hypothetical protein
MQKRIRCGTLALFIAVASVGMARADAVLTFTSPTLTTHPAGRLNLTVPSRIPGPTTFI